MATTGKRAPPVESESPAKMAKPAPGAAADGSVLCHTPSLVQGIASVAISPNAQQFGAGANYTFYAPPVVSATVPSSGPSAGGTVVVAAGAMMGAAVASNKASSSSSTMTIACADIPTANEPFGV